MATERHYSWSAIFYGSEEELHKGLKKTRHWAYAYHDQDTKLDENGDLVTKEPHFHVILTFEREQSFQQVRTIFESDQNCLAQPVKNIIGCYRYLLHEDDTNKFQYAKDKRITDNNQYWTKRCKETIELYQKTDSFFEDLTATEGFSIRAMGRKYGRDFMKNMEAYLKYRRACQQEAFYEIAEEKKNTAEEKLIDSIIDKSIEMNIKTEIIDGGKNPITGEQITITYN